MLDYAYTNHQDAFKISIISNSQLCCSHMNYLLSELWTRSKNTANKISLVFLLGKKWKAVNHCVKSMKELTGLFSHGGVYEQKKGWGPKGKGSESDSGAESITRRKAASTSRHCTVWTETKSLCAYCSSDSHRMLQEKEKILPKMGRREKGRSLLHMQEKRAACKSIGWKSVDKYV